MPQSYSASDIVRQFNEAFERQDVDAVMALMTEDCVFDDTTPPGGRRHEGQAAVRAYWESLFASNPHARWDFEETIVAGDRCVVRWTFWFGDEADGHVRGVDIFKLRNGLIAEKLSYVKG